MKRLLFIAAVILGVYTTTNAKSAIGVRFTYGGEFSYQTDALGNRTEFSAGWAHDYFGAGAVYQLVFPIKDGFSWYYGFGARIGLGGKNDFELGGVGNIGIEYNFDFPLQLSLDWQPAYYLVPFPETLNKGFHGGNVGLGVRYKF